MTVKLLTKHHLEFLAQARLSLHIYYWKSRVMAHIYLVLYYCPIVYNRVYIRLFEDIGTVVVEVYIVVCIHVFLILLYLLV